jgi:hypothetical protein
MRTAYQAAQAGESTKKRCSATNNGYLSECKLIFQAEIIFATGRHHAQPL